jgi:hypothetical protein
MIFFKRLGNALYHIKNVVKAELYPIYYDYIKRHFDGLKKKNEYVSIPESTELDLSIWKYSFVCQSFHLSLIPIAIDNIKYELNLSEHDFHDSYAYDLHNSYTYDYKNIHEVTIIFRDETIFNKTFKEFQKLIDINKKVTFAEEISKNNFDLLYSQIYNPKSEKFIKVIPNKEKVYELIITLIKYYENAGYKLNDKIFNQTLFVAADEKISYLIYSDSEAMASEISFIIMSNNLAEIIE